jgi:mRNA-degrading endonuclease RelE of RelBE toxin-antitoxin system
LKKLSADEIKSLFAKLHDLCGAWLPHANVKHLVNYTLASFRMRYGKYRILFDIEWEYLVVHRILHRSKLY